MNIQWNNIDIHSHILPNVDDGSKDIDMTKRMIEMAVKQNTLTMIATPHFTPGGNNKEIDYLEFKLEQVRREAIKIHPDFKLYLGHEIYYTDGAVEAVKSGQALTLAASRYVLVEFSPSRDYNSIYRAISKFIQAGYMPIIAHVERYECLKKREDLILELTELGAYIQVNANSLMGGIFNSHANRCRKLVEQGLVHFIATDCHSDSHRSPILLDATEILLKKNDSHDVHRITMENQMKILENTFI